MQSVLQAYCYLAFTSFFAAQFIELVYRPIAIIVVAILALDFVALAAIHFFDLVEETEKEDISTI